MVFLKRNEGGGKVEEDLTRARSPGRPVSQEAEWQPQGLVNLPEGNEVVGANPRLPSPTRKVRSGAMKRLWAESHGGRGRLVCARRAYCCVRDVRITEA